MTKLLPEPPAYLAFRSLTRMAGRLPEEVKQQARSQTVLGRTGSADDIAQLVVTYCKTESVTGQTIVVDGGSPIGMR